MSGIRTISPRSTYFPSSFPIKMNQLLIRQDMPVDYLGYVTRLDKLDTDVRVVCQRRNLRINSQSNPTSRGNPTSSSFTFSFNPNHQPPASNALSYQPPPPSSQTTTPSLLLLVVHHIVPKTCSVRDIISSCRAHVISRKMLLLWAVLQIVAVYR